MQNRNILNGEHELTKGRWVLSFVRRLWSIRGYLIVEGFDEHDKLIRRKVELGYKELGLSVDNQMVYDKSHGQIDYTDLSIDMIESMRQEQDKCICKIYKIDQEDKMRLERKISDDQNREIVYNLEGEAKSSRFFSASLEAYDTDDLKDKAGETKLLASASSSAVLKSSYNSISWAEEAVCAANSAFDPKTNFEKYVVVIPEVVTPKVIYPEDDIETRGTKCILM